MGNKSTTGPNPMQAPQATPQSPKVELGLLCLWLERLEKGEAGDHTAATMPPLVPRKLVTHTGCFSVESTDQTDPSAAWLTISRKNLAADFDGTDSSRGVVLTLESTEAMRSREGDARSRDIDAVVGIFQLLSGPYLCVCTGSTLVANGPANSSFHRIDRVQLLGLQGAATLTKDQQRDEKQFLGLITSVFATKSFYFAANYEITHTAQRIYEQSLHGGPDAMSPTAWTRADPRFFWNLHLLQDFVRAREVNVAVDNFVTPVINGFVSYKPEVSAGSGVPTFDLLLVSRRSRNRQGTRFHRRGIDTAGDVANFVETEQLLLHADGRISSHVQVRGSIPVFWTQTPTMKYTPKCALLDAYADSAVVQACSGHFRGLNTVYGGDVVAVNLIDTKGDQLMLGQAYEAAVQKAQATGAAAKYVWFDFHKECRKMQWHKLSNLMDMVEGDLDKQGIFTTGPDGVMTRRQVGVMRTNCMDNLDRTNVVQSLFGRWAILQALQGGGALPKPPSVLDSGLASLERTFKATWADNADAMSMLYSGTPALKTDFTRTGKRTTLGKLQDGKHSLIRYFLNNLADGRRQDAWDLFLGRYSPVTSGGKQGYISGKSPLRAAQREATPATFLLGVLLLNVVIMGGTIATMTALGSSASFTSKATVGSFVSVAILGLVSFLEMGRGRMGWGKTVVSKPHFTDGDVDRDPVA